MNPDLEKTKKSKRKITIILVVAVVLAIASIITAFFYFKIIDLSPSDTNASQGCACYFVKATDTVKSCATATPQMAYEFRTGTVGSSGACSASCDTNTALPISTNEAGVPTILSCKIADFVANPGCIDISVSQESDKRAAEEIDPQLPTTITAKFANPSNAVDASDYFSGFSIISNGEKVEFQPAQATTTGTGASKTYSVTTIIKNFKSANSLTLQAFGKTTTGVDLTSSACTRVLTISQPKSATCTSLDASIINDTSGKPKVNEVSLTTVSIPTPTTLSIKFTVGTSNQTLTTKNIASKFANNTLVLNQSYLYSSSSFIDGKSFSILNNSTDTIKIGSEVYVNGTKINSSSCVGTFVIPKIDSNTTTPTDNNSNDTTDNMTPDTTPTEDTGTTSNFKITKTGSETCVERATPDNSIVYTLKVKNNDTDTEEIVRVEDKLPLGFTYKAGSTLVNGIPVSDSSYITKATVGSSQQITFKKSSNWSVAPTGSLVIKFTATASSTALSGTNLNEAVAIPLHTPINNANVRTSLSVTVAQSCTSPQTGLFDSTLAKVVAGILIIILGIILYVSQSGIALSQKLLGMGPIRNAKRVSNMIRLKITDPRRYFEEKMIRKIDKD
ncbi:hypothetical protein M0R04_02220 [Candidatus Dojkabacteria bacterium]|jgi:hypothetical protein|nr:hypothetical protein [Candidatus Dojkabacteria bacterium]